MHHVGNKRSKFCMNVTYNISINIQYIIKLLEIFRLISPLSYNPATRALLKPMNR